MGRIRRMAIKMTNLELLKYARDGVVQKLIYEEKAVTQ